MIRSMVLATLLQALSTSLRAEVRVTGEADAVKIEANDTSVEELLIKLSNIYGVRYSSSADLSRSVSGAFDGPLQQAISRVLLLQGYNFSIETTSNIIEVSVYGKDALHGNSVGSAASAVTAPSRHVSNSSRHALSIRAVGHGKLGLVARINHPHSAGAHRLQVPD
ncbi:hypothetical protein QEV83_05500 [Methylocapsa sp. D3K7]|uniref:hypothetical protein n=1 Tax=Methylocapsa sp. D3K7 TaxID=3041435 RepID=UPI00244EC558|nr:hypothetical protein [Methylocapsa sp. D3K7]WGJ15716.1 hypothetical protein QEV83_05500 [Methylocapsa sp. D3K7]